MQLFSLAYAISFLLNIMIIDIEECNGSQITGSILPLLLRYDRIDKFFEDADKGIVSIPDLDCTVIFGGVPHQFCQQGVPDEGRKKWIREMHKLPVKRRMIPCDTLKITEDMFEREVNIYI